MGFVNASALWLWWPWVFENIFFVLRWMPEYSIIDRREIQVLGNASDPCRYSLQTFM